jgi:hypothetical protein
MKTIDRSRTIAFTVAMIAALASACGGGSESTSGGSGGAAGTAGTGGASGTGGTAGGQVQPQTVTVSGTVVDFETGSPVAGSATLSATGLVPAPTISTTAAEFKIEGVAPYSTFYLLAGSPPTYRNTYNAATEVEASDVSGVEQAVVSETLLAKLEDAFGIKSAAGTGVMIALAVDEVGTPKAGVPAAAFTVNDAPPPRPPSFLDAQLGPAPGMTATSASGYVIFYDIPAGSATIGAAMGSGYTIVGAQTPTAASVVSLVTLQVTAGDPVLPKNVSFSTQVVPIFNKRGCEVCHSGNSPGADLGNLSLNGSDNSIYKELTQELSKNFGIKRIDLMAPEKSLVLTMPSLEDPPDPHPNVTFTGAADPDYLLLLSWIKEGAKQN